MKSFGRLLDFRICSVQVSTSLGVVGLWWGSSPAAAGSAMVFSKRMFLPPSRVGGTGKKVGKFVCEF